MEKEIKMKILSLFQNGKEDNYLSALKDPFGKDKVIGIRIYSQYLNSSMDSNYFKPGWCATVEFRNGQTKGEQQFETVGIDSFPLIIKQVEDFLKHLK